MNCVRVSVRFSVPTSVILLKYKSRPNDFKVEEWPLMAYERISAPSAPSLLA